MTSAILLNSPHFQTAISQISADTPLGNVLGELALAIQSVVPSSTCIFLALHGGSVEPVAPSLNAATLETLQRAAFRIVAGLNEAAADVLITHSIADCCRTPEVAREAAGQGLHWSWSTLIHSAAGDCLGALLIWAGDQRPPTVDESMAISLTKGLALAAIEHRQLCAQMTHQAIHDPLTGLANRFLLDQELNRAALTAVHHDRSAALLLLNVDNFRIINEAICHDTGDAVLAEVARRIQSCLGPSDTAGRISGDEFGIALSESEPEAMSRRLIDAFVTPIAVGRRELFITVTIGIAICPQHGRHAAALRRSADAALARAKQDNRGGYSIYIDTMNAAARERVELAADLRVAMDRDELEVHYQPQVLADGSLVGYEALLRWRHPIHGYVSPAKFVPIAEMSGLIPIIGKWVLQTACRQAAVWRVEGRDVRMAVNVSAIQLAQPDFVSQVLDALVDAGLEAEALELELTESLLVGDSSAVSQKLNDLRVTGIRIAIDDFGTGYSSLAYLQQLPIDSLKIDRSFVSQIDPQGPAAGSRTAIIRAMMSLARELQLTVTAEGVETVAQQRFLQEIGCQQLQGYLFGKPQPAQSRETPAAVRRAS